MAQPLTPIQPESGCGLFFQILTAVMSQICDLTGQFSLIFEAGIADAISTLK